MNETESDINMNREISKWKRIRSRESRDVIQVGTILKLKYSESPILVIVTKLCINGVEGVIITNRERTCIHIVYLENYMYFNTETQNGWALCE